MDDYDKIIENLKETINRLMVRLKEHEEKHDLLFENRELLKEDRKRLQAKVQDKENYIQFAEQRHQKAQENFVEFLMESYTETYIN